MKSGKNVNDSFSEKTFKAELRRRIDVSDKIEYQQYHLDGAVAKERGAQKAAESFQAELITVWTTVDSSKQRLPNFMRRTETDVNNGFAGFCLSFYKKLES